jgi:hypothetical protein
LPRSLDLATVWLLIGLAVFLAVLGKLHFTQADGVMRLDTSNGGWN